MCTYTMKRLASRFLKGETCIDVGPNGKSAGSLEARKLASDAAYAENVKNLERAVAAMVSDAAYAMKIKIAAE